MSISRDKDNNKGTVFASSTPESYSEQESSEKAVTRGAYPSEISSMLGLLEITKDLRQCIEGLVTVCEFLSLRVSALEKKKKKK